MSGANQTKSSYKLTIKGDITQEVLGARNTLTTILDLRYSWLEADTETDRFLRLDAAFMEGKMGTNAMMKSILSTNRFLLAQGAQNMDVTCENAHPAIKARMAALSSPICRLSFDEQGRETGREMQKNAALQPLIDSGFVANVLFFHPPFFPARKQWQHTNEISVGGGAFAQGVLTYQPEPAGSTNMW